MVCCLRAYSFCLKNRSVNLADEHEPLVAVLKRSASASVIQQLNPEVDLQQARSVSYRLADLLPLEPEIKQALLQMNWPKERLSELRRLVGKFRG